MDAPDSFRENHAEVADEPPAYWERLTRAVTEPAHSAMLLACVGDVVPGSTYALLDRDRAGRGRVGGMWVDPGWRRKGLGAALLSAVFDWARAHELTSLGLWAPAQHPAPMGLYESVGFRTTGADQPLGPDSQLTIIEMVCDLSLDRS